MKKLLFTSLLSLAVAYWGIAPVKVQGESPSEYAVKAAFLYNFTKFVEWPKDVINRIDSLTIAIYGENPFGNSLENTIAGKTVHSKPMQIKYISDLDSIENYQIIYFVGSTESEMKSLLSKTKGLPVLTISDFEDFAKSGGAIGFYLENNRVRFEINNQTAVDSKLIFSSKLLNIARVINSDDKE